VVRHPSRRTEKIVIPGRRAVASPEPMNTGRARLAPPVFMGSRVRGNDGCQAVSAHGAILLHSEAVRR